jgi:DNA-binding XRE family transcriptional regulator
MNTLGQVIRKARIDFNMSQRELQRAIGMSQKQLWAIEYDRVDPRWSTVVKIARVLKLPLDDMVHRRQ